MRSLTLKLILAFAVVCLVEAVLVAALVRQVTRQSFDRFVQEEAVQGFIEEATAHYAAHGSWAGLEAGLRRRPGPPPRIDGTPPPGKGGQPGNNPRYGLADLNGYVVLSNGVHERGASLPPEALAAGTPLVVDDTLRAIVLMPEQRIPFDRRARDYLARTDTVLLLATLGALLVALALGAWIARTYMRPLRELTAATRTLARGEFAQQVPVRTRDELGTLTQAFNQMSADLAEAAGLRRRMTADIAHDLRTPLTVLTGYLEALRDGDLPPSPERFDTMYTEAKHLGRLVEDLRTLSLADAGELSLHLQAVSPHALLKRIRAGFEQQAREKHVDLTIQAASSLPDLWVDSDRMTQVLANLVNNALRYTPEGGRITLTAQAHGTQITLQVIDTGAGIPAEALSYIFNRFYRADASRRRQEGESGLGLAIARSIVEAHAGTIEAESEPGRGTTFTMTLPKNSTHEARS